MTGKSTSQRREAAKRETAEKAAEFNRQFLGRLGEPSIGAAFYERVFQRDKKIYPSEATAHYWIEFYLRLRLESPEPIDFVIPFCENFRRAMKLLKSMYPGVSWKEMIQIHSLGRSCIRFRWNNASGRIEVDSPSDVSWFFVFSDFLPAQEKYRGAELITAQNAPGLIAVKNADGRPYHVYDPEMGWSERNSSIHERIVRQFAETCRISRSDLDWFGDRTWKIFDAKGVRVVDVRPIPFVPDEDRQAEILNEHNFYTRFFQLRRSLPDPAVKSVNVMYAFEIEMTFPRQGDSEVYRRRLRQFADNIMKAQIVHVVPRFGGTHTRSSRIIIRAAALQAETRLYEKYGSLAVVPPRAAFAEVEEALSIFTPKDWMLFATQACSGMTFDGKRSRSTIPKAPSEPLPLTKAEIAILITSLLFR